MMDQRNGNRENLGELPKGWVWTTLGGLIEPSREKVDPLKLPESVYVGLEHIESGTGKLLGHGHAKEVRSTKTKFYRGDLMYGKLRPYLNKVHVPDFEGVCSTDILVFPKNPYLDNKYLLFRLLRDDFVRYANINVSGVQHPRVDFKTLSRFDIPLPPLGEQHRIVTKIEELFSDLDAGVAALQKTKAQLKRYRQAVLKAAVEGKLTTEWRAANAGKIQPASALLEQIRAERAKNANGKSKPVPPLDTAELGELPKGWEWTSLHKLSWDAGYGTSVKCDYEYTGAPVLRIPNIAKGRIDLADLKFASDLDSFNTTDALAEGDLLIVRTNGSRDLIGRAALIARGFEHHHYFASYLIRFRLFNIGSLPLWVSTIWHSPRIREWIEHVAATTAGQYNVSMSVLNRLPLPVPPLAEQEQVVAEVERRLSVADEIERTVDASLKQAERLRQSILKRAFAGKLVPQDPNDEPAERLLERIKSLTPANSPTGSRKTGENKRKNTNPKQPKLI